MEIKRSTIDVLLIEDNPGDARLIREYLAPAGDEKFDVTITERLASGIDALQDKSFDVVLLDLSLPDSDGLATFETVHGQSPPVPVIVLTGLDDKNIGVSAVKAGAQDYLLKGEVDSSVLVRTIRHSIERASLEWQIVQSNKTLEERVELRTQELEIVRERASRSEKLALIGQLSGGVAHDLRNPLGAIKNAAYYLKRKCKVGWSDQNGEDISQWLDLIEREVTSANDVITNLLSFGSSKELLLSKMQICEAIQDSLDSLTLDPRIKLSINIDPYLPPVMGDPAQLTRVFQNLLGNAKEAMQHDGGITISAQRKGESVRIVISDTGSGISPENIEKIFEPLYTAKPNGTGLGLAICQDIVNKHNGSISVKSEIGAGTSFTILLPAAP